MYFTHKNMNIELDSIFGVPLLETTIEFSRDVIYHIHSLEYQRTDYDNADISLSMDVLDHPLMKKYGDKIDECVNKFIFEYVKFDKEKVFLKRSSSWSNRYYPNDWCQDHKHSNSFITGVWYLETPENCGDLDLKTPYYAFGEPNSYQVTEYNSVNCYQWTCSALPGKLYIFPSVIRHSVQKNRSNQVRTCIAFNYNVNGKVYCENKLIDY